MTEQEIQALREERDHYQSRTHELAEQLFRLTRTTGRAAETIADLGDRLTAATEALTIAAATLESAMAQIQKSAPVVEAALDFYRTGRIQKVREAVEALIKAEPS